MVRKGVILGCQSACDPKGKSKRAGQRQGVNLSNNHAKHLKTSATDRTEKENPDRPAKEGKR